MPPITPHRSAAAPRLLITAGPTHEPIDDVRFIGNRSSGRLGIALARAAVDAGWTVTLLLGPVGSPPDLPPAVETLRFRTCADLRRLLHAHFPSAEALIMAAAVADYTPAPAPPGSKIRRADGPISLTLHPTPDLLAEAGAARRPDQTIVGFALEPRDRLLASAAAKLRRKRIDMIVANPLETMDAPTIEAAVLFSDGRSERTATPMPKPAFAAWLLDLIAAERSDQGCCPARAAGRTAAVLSTC